TDTESKPFKGKARTPESPHIAAPPTCHVEESEGSGTFGARSTSLDSTAPLSPEHPLTHTTPYLVPILRRTARMAVRVPPVMSPGLSVDIAGVAAMSDLAFRKSEEVEESSDSDSESDGVKDEGPTVEDEDPPAGDEGLRHGLDDEGCGVDIDGLGLEEEEEAVPGGQHQAALVVGTAVSAPLRLGYGALRHQELALEGDHVYTYTHHVDIPENGMVYIDVSVYPPSTSPVQTQPLPEWTSGSLPISPSPSVVPSHVSSPMILLTVPSPIASPMATSTTTIPVDED
nr:hypothetical protein [Tanacetum cinerariifolium]